jgi:hypothetical protein
MRFEDYGRGEGGTRRMFTLTFISLNRLFGRLSIPSGAYKAYN